MSSATGTMASGDDLTELRDELVLLLIRAGEGKFTREEIDPSANIFDFGYADSLTGVVFLAEIEERFGIELDDMEVVESLNTLDLLAARLHELRARS